LTSNEGDATIPLICSPPGIDPSHISVVSKGKEAPFCTEHNEACWQENRRSDHIATRVPVARLATGHELIEIGTPQAARVSRPDR